MTRKLTLLLMGLSILAGIQPVQAGSEPARVQVLSATSSKDPGFDLTTLLDSSASPGWKPGLSGTGADEGILIQLEKPVSVDEVALKGQGRFAISVNGEEFDGKDNRFKFDTAVKIKSLFIHVPSGDGKPGELQGFELRKKGKALVLPKPLIVQGEVEAEKVLSPEVAYGPFRLFDSKTDMGFALDGKKIDTRKPISLFGLKFKKSIRLKGFTIWNGYQRSKEHYYSNVRPHSIEVTDGKDKAAFELKDEMGPQSFDFPGGGWDVSKLDFTADSVYPGESYKDLVISEVSFETPENRTVMVDVPKTLGILSKLMKPAVDWSLKSYPAQGKDKFFLKFRRDGTFAAIDQETAKSGGTVRCVWEGNWQMEKPDQLKVFGRYYQSSPDLESVYGVGISTQQSGIFQTKMKIIPLEGMSTAQKHKYYGFEKKSLPEGNVPEDENGFWEGMKDRQGVFFLESDLFSFFVVRDQVGD